MKEYTKEERNAIYRQALIESRNGICPPYGLCTWISLALRKIYDTIDVNIELFPEIYKHKPSTTYSVVHWFDIRDKQTRIDILKQAIKETEQ